MTGKQAALEVLQETCKKFERMLATHKELAESIKTIAEVYAEAKAKTDAYMDAFDEGIKEAGIHQESNIEIPSINNLSEELLKIFDWQLDAEIFYCSAVLEITKICQSLEREIEIDMENLKLLRPIPDEHSAEESC